MLLWIASHPRSGSALTRSILYRCFGVPSLTDKRWRGTGKPGTISGITGTTTTDRTPDELPDLAREDERLVGVKTHGFPPTGTERAIYVIRDGRAALSSYKRFLEGQRIDRDIRNIILGTSRLRCWSEHVKDWLAQPWERVLVLRYEALSQPSAETLNAISTFLGLPILRGYDITFDDFRKASPARYTRGTNGPGIEEIERECGPLFWSVHGPMMQRLGYGRPPDGIKPLPREELREHWRQASARR